MSPSLTQPDPTAIQRVNPLAVADWDERIARFSGAGIFHSAAWARVLHETYRYEPCYLVQGEGAAPAGILPLMEVDSRLTGRRGVSLPFTDAVDPLVTSPAAAAALFAAAREYAHARDWKYLEYRGGRAWLPSAPASTSFHQHSLALTANEAALLAGCDDAVRRALRKAERSDLQVEFSQDLGAVRAFHNLLCLTRRRHGLPPQPLAFFASLQRHMLAANLGWVVLVRRGAQPVAGAIFFHFGRSALYKFGASDEAFQEFRPNNLAMWAALRRYAREGFHTFDFGRTSVTNEGLRRFKLGWGSTETSLDYVRFDLRLDRFVSVPDGANGWHNRVFRVLPAWISRSLGAVLYRHMG